MPKSHNISEKVLKRGPGCGLTFPTGFRPEFLLLPGLGCEHGFDGFGIAPFSKGKH